MIRTLAVIGFILVSIFSQAQLQSPDTLSLARAIAIGLQNNFDIQVEQHNIGIAANNNNWGQAGALPSINLIGNGNNSVVQRKPANPFAVAGRNISDNIL